MQPLGGPGSVWVRREAGSNARIKPLEVIATSMTPITPNNAQAGIEMVQAAAIMLSRVALIAINTELQSPITADCSSSPEKGGLFLEYFVADGVIACRSLTPAEPPPLGLMFPMLSLGVSVPISPAN